MEIHRRMATRFTRLLVALGLLLGVALPSAAAAVVRLPTSQDIATSPVPARGADPAYARSYFGARYYRAQIGRFTTIDPLMTIEENLEDPQRWNRYAYALNNPLKFTDPDGRTPLWLIGAGVGGAAGFVGSAVSQWIDHGHSSDNFSWREAGASALGGAVSGGLAAGTLGMSALAESGLLTATAVNGGANAIGNAVGRAANGRTDTQAIDGKAIVKDFVVGATGAAIGAKVGSSVAAPVVQMENSAAGMIPPAMKGNYGAQRGLLGAVTKIEKIQFKANVPDMVFGAQITNIAVPVYDAVKKQQ